MKQVFTKVLLTSILLVTANAGDKFNNLTEEYLFGTSVEVRTVIANDPQTAIKTLKILAKDTNNKVSIAAKNNLK